MLLRSWQDSTFTSTGVLLLEATPPHSGHGCYVGNGQQSTVLVRFPGEGRTLKYPLNASPKPDFYPNHFLTGFCLLPLR